MSARPQFCRTVYTNGMSDYSHKLALHQAGASISRRWPVLLAASAVLHLLVLGWINGHLVLPFAPDEQTSLVTTVELRPQALPALAPKTSARSRPKPDRVARSPVHPHPLPLPPPAEVFADAPTTSVMAPESPLVAQSTAADNSADPVSASHEADIGTKADAPVDQPPLVHYNVSLPPPVELNYDVEQVPIDGAPRTGSGTISWQIEGGRYKVTGKAKLLYLITLFTFESEGMLDDYGIAPVLYSEKPMNRSETNTHFNRDDRNNISFSSSTISYPLHGGEQDRASILWELAGIGRGDRGKFTPGAHIDFFVAGMRDGDTWSIDVIGQEEIDTGIGKMQTWHLARNPRAGTYDKKTEIWLAPQYEWYPVKVRTTEKSGKYVDMTLSSHPHLLVADTRLNSTR